MYLIGTQKWVTEVACKCCTEKHQRCSLPIWPTLSCYYSSGILKTGGTEALPHFLPRFNVKESIEGTKRAKKADLKKCCNDPKHKVTPESENIDKPLKKRLRVIKADDVSPTPPSSLHSSTYSYRTPTGFPDSYWTGLGL
jgi:hypothetical protein